MKKLASTLPNMVISLVTITVAAGALLGWVYSITKEPIALQAAAQQKAAIAEVAPPFTNNPEDDKWVKEIEGNQFTVYPAYSDGNLDGAAVKGETMNGFAGQIIVMCGFNADGTVRDYRVLQQAETPGLGTKMEEWFRDPTAARSVINKNPETTQFYVSKDTNGEIDAITAATISSRAFLETLRNAYEAYKDYKNSVSKPNTDSVDGSSGATKQPKK
ncbi:MAG: RnfABCDGE type electron transport complex subunit G [Bacteroides sp.]|nr:RnfABCDGE type electron transport complex subunit G [Bacteroides sp.]